MNPVDIIILIAAVAIVGGFIAVAIWRKKTGRSKGCGCGYDCGSCSGCPSARKDKE
jgi:hypothetical protein